MQSCYFKEPTIKKIEKICFEFLWNKKINAIRAYERISRKTLKLPASQGGINAPDIESLNLALKVNQYIRSTQDNIKHAISYFQTDVLNLNRDLMFNRKTCNFFVNQALGGLMKLGSIMIKEISESNDDCRLNKEYYNQMASEDAILTIKICTPNKIVHNYTSLVCRSLGI